MPLLDEDIYHEPAVVRRLRAQGLYHGPLPDGRTPLPGEFDNMELPPEPEGGFPIADIPWLLANTDLGRQQAAVEERITWWFRFIVYGSLALIFSRLVIGVYNAREWRADTVEQMQLDYDAPTQTIVWALLKNSFIRLCGLFGGFVLVTIRSIWTNIAIALRKIAAKISAAKARIDRRIEDFTSNWYYMRFRDRVRRTINWFADNFIWMVLFSPMLYVGASFAIRNDAVGQVGRWIELQRNLNDNRIRWNWRPESRQFPGIPQVLLRRNKWDIQGGGQDFANFPEAIPVERLMVTRSDDFDSPPARISMVGNKKVYCLKCQQWHCCELPY